MEAAAASFGVILRGFKFKGEAALEQTLTLARKAKGADRDGYRAEFIRLVEEGHAVAGRGSPQIIAAAGLHGAGNSPDH